MPDAAPASGILYSFPYIGILHRHGKLVFERLRCKLPVIANQCAHWCGNPPVERNQVTITTKNRSDSHFFWVVFGTFPLYPGDCHDQSADWSRNDRKL